MRQLILIKSEFVVARVATRELAHGWARWSGTAEMAGVRLQDVERAVHNLEGTFTVRLFSEFEAILLDHFRVNFPKERLPGSALSLINRAATRRRIRDEIRDGAHRIREYRNALVHHLAGLPVYSFSQALTSLNRFVAPLPD